MRGLPWRKMRARRTRSLRRKKAWRVTCRRHAGANQHGAKLRIGNKWSKSLLLGIFNSYNFCHLSVQLTMQSLRIVIHFYTWNDVSREIILSGWGCPHFNTTSSPQHRPRARKWPVSATGRLICLSLSRTTDATCAVRAPHGTAKKNLSLGCVMAFHHRVRFSTNLRSSV